jgi:putative ABC transport system permease protein
MIVKKDFKRNKLINIVLILFIVLSAFLMSIATMIIFQLFNSIDSMYEVAKPPHFLQMHVGEFEQSKIDEFASSIDYVEHWQTVEMVNIYGGNIWITKPNGSTSSMSDSLLDMGWVKQNNQYDLLLDMDNKPLQPKQGEIGVPLILLDRYDIEIGDTITVKDDNISMDFVVSSYVRDPQMNSALVSSTRFLINEADFENFKEQTGSIEYIIESYYKSHIQFKQ